MPCIHASFLAIVQPAWRCPNLEAAGYGKWEAEDPPRHRRHRQQALPILQPTSCTSLHLQIRTLPAYPSQSPMEIAAKILPSKHFQPSDAECLSSQE